MTARSWSLALAMAATFIIAACTVPQQTANSQGTAADTMTNNTTTNGTE
jgi:hypothetical protein